MVDRLQERNKQMNWLTLAKSYIGLSEVPGKEHNPKIVGWWKAIKATFIDDETPWCAAFVGGVLEECGIRSTRSAMARSYTKWGLPLAGPVVGAVVIFWRGSILGPSGHVGFVVGKDRRGNLMVLGGNQGDKVSILPFNPTRILDFRWPEGVPLPFCNWYNLPIVDSNGEVSTNEA
jgi:uncharacterized protein (TIGR02594 family)